MLYTMASYDRKIMTFADIHTHRRGIASSIYSAPPGEVAEIVAANALLPPERQQYYSLQLHPWYLEEGFADVARRYATDPHLVAIGECGLDALCPTPMERQLVAFRLALATAQELQRPVIIHCVRCWQEVIRECAAYDLPLKVIHGFRRGPDLAQQLLRAGFSLSLGERFHPDVPSLVPHDCLFHETD